MNVEEIIRNAESLILSVTAHYDCEEGSEFDDIASILQYSIDEYRKSVQSKDPEQELKDAALKFIGLDREMDEEEKYFNPQAPQYDAFIAGANWNSKPS